MKIKEYLEKYEKTQKKIKKCIKIENSFHIKFLLFYVLLHSFNFFYNYYSQKKKETPIPAGVHLLNTWKRW